jgi:hypothetical protein
MKTISALVISSALLSVHAWIAAPAGRVATVAARRLSPVMHAETGQDAGNLSRRSVATRGLFGLAAGLAPWASRADAADIAEPFEVAFIVQLNADEAGEVVFKVMGCIGKPNATSVVVYQYRLSRSQSSKLCVS